jgi:hypothetical protein
MSVQTFLAKAEALKNKGPMALFSSDLKLLVRQVKTDAAAIKAERLLAQRAGRQPAYCPKGETQLGQKDILTAMEAVPAAQRSSTDTRSGLRAYFARRFPCAKQAK